MVSINRLVFYFCTPVLEVSQPVFPDAAFFLAYLTSQEATKNILQQGFEVLLK
jgi:hypothetical protein